MGWYDAFNSNVNTAAILKNTTSDKGSAAKNFGDAFVSFGKSMREVDSERKKEALADANIASAKARTEFTLTQNDQTKKDTEFTNDTRKTKKLDDAFLVDVYSSPDVDYKRSLIEFEKPDEDFGTDVSSNAFKLAKQDIEHQEDRLNTTTAQLKDMEAKKKEISYLEKLHAKNAKIDLLKLEKEREKSQGGKKLTTQQRAQRNDVLKRAQGISDFTQDKNGNKTYDKEQLLFLTNYMDKNYDPSNYEKMINDAKGAYELLKADKRAEEVDTLMDDMKEYENLTPDQKRIASEYYIKNGVFPTVKADTHFFGEDKYTLDIEKNKETAQSENNSKPPKTSMFADFKKSQSK